MKVTRAMFVIPLLLLLSSPGEAANLSDLFQPSQCANVTKATAQPAPLLASTTMAYCEASCGNGSVVSCSGSVCSAEDQICPEELGGYVTCDGQTYSCGTCPLPPTCTPGEQRQEPDGCCTQYKGRLRWYECNSNYEWEWTPAYSCREGCEPIDP